VARRRAGPDAHDRRHAPPADPDRDRRVRHIGLPAADVAALAELLYERDEVLRVAAGHIHRVIPATVGGVPVTVAPSAWRQAVLDIGPEGRAVVADAEPPGYALHLLTDDGVLVTHAAII
jgi:hypothetical protein